MDITEIKSGGELDSLIREMPHNTIITIYAHNPRFPACTRAISDFQAIANQAPQYLPGAPKIFVYFNAEAVDELAERYQVHAVPFFIVTQGGVIKKPVTEVAKLRNYLAAH